MYETDENKDNGDPRMQNVTADETLAALMHEENPISLSPYIHIVNNPVPVNSKCMKL